MEILIIDDDLYSIQGVRDGVHWAELGIAIQREARSAAEARDILKREKVDICLCDIEMPDEDGLSLLAWMNEHSPQTLTIFYSCHADFLYAQKALEYRAFDYILKPSSYVEIEKTLKKAILKLTDEQFRQFQQDVTLRRSQASGEKFFTALLDGAIPPTPREISRAISYKSVFLDENALRLPVLISIRNWAHLLQNWVQIDIEFIIKNLAEELYQLPEIHDIVVFPYQQRFYLVMLTSQSSITQQSLYLPSQRLLHVLQEHTGAEALCCLGEAVPLANLPELVRELIRRMRHFSGGSHVLMLAKEEDSTEQSIEEPILEQWRDLLLSEKGEELQKSVGQVFAGSNFINDYRLEQFYTQYTHMIFNLLKSKDIPYTHLIEREDFLKLKRRATWSSEDLEQYIQFVNAFILHILEHLHNSVGTVERVKQMIAERIGEELTRENLAQEIFLNPDYLSRIFKKETGMSLTEYILSVRMAKAKELLAMPGMSISMVAYQTGYTSLPYFCKVFKRETGVTPGQYKQSLEKYMRN